jgi:aminodeoxychorismate synthase component I
VLDRSRPFVLLDDASPGGAGGRLFAEPEAVLEAWAPGEVRPLLEALRGALAEGFHAAGFLGFEAGCALEPRLAGLYRPPVDGLPLAWFGLFREALPLDAAALTGLLAGEASVRRWTPQITPARHAAAVGRIKRLIEAGDIYQANLTFPCAVELGGDPLALYGRLRPAQQAPFGAVVGTGAAYALSFSPELFFQLKAGALTARPMKGTAARDPGAGTAQDDDAARALANDPKNRAENLMIVDLLRNDLSKIAQAGSVAVPLLFQVETYPTVHQMTSTIAARLAPGLDALDVLAAMFPCGSVTGAPKIRALEVIAALEPAPRGLYTGAIGVLSPDGDAAFNVAIRTLVVGPDGAATLALGSGIVADSTADAEWEECLAKGRFLDLARG